MFSTILTATASGSGSTGILIFLVIIVFFIVAYWRLFTKAGEPGWGAIIPIYNLYLYCKSRGDRSGG